MGVYWRARRGVKQISLSGLAARTLRTAIEQFGGRIESLDLPIVAADSAAWLDRHDPRWLQEELAAYGMQPRHLFQLGKHHYLRGNFFHAECYLHGAVEAASTAEAISLLASCYAAMDDPHRLAELLERFSSSFDSTPTPLVELADQRLLSDFAGSKSLAGYLVVDIRGGGNIDLVCDLNQLPWPIDDSSGPASSPRISLSI